MQTRSKVVELSGTRYQISKLQPEVGSFILMRMLGVSMRMAADQAERPVKKGSKKQAEAAKEEETKISGEMRVRAISFAVFSGGLNFDDFKFIQDACMQAIGKIKVEAGVDLPMPIVSDTGVWVDEEVSNSVSLIMRLTTEVLIFCFADFFDGGGIGL